MPRVGTDVKARPRVGAQSTRLAFFDFLAFLNTIGLILLYGQAYTIDLSSMNDLILTMR